VREYLLHRLEGLIETYKMLPIVGIAQKMVENQEFNSYILFTHRRGGNSRKKAARQRLLI